MKNKYPIFILLVLMPFLLTACKLLPTKTDSSGDTSKVDNSGSSMENQNFKGTAFDLLKLGKDYRCTFEQITPDGSVTGISYISGDKVKTEVKLESKTAEDKMSFESNSLVDGDWVYQWGSMMENGIKMNVEKFKDTAPDELEVMENPEFQKGVAEEFEYDCDDWKVDKKVFELPSDIEFTDMSVFMDKMEETVEKMEQGTEAMQESMEGMKESLCAACESAPNRTECKENLGCE